MQWGQFRKINNADKDAGIACLRTDPIICHPEGLSPGGVLVSDDLEFWLESGPRVLIIWAAYARSLRVGIHTDDTLNGIAATLGVVWLGQLNQPPRPLKPDLNGSSPKVSGSHATVRK